MRLALVTPLLLTGLGCDSTPTGTAPTNTATGGTVTAKIGGSLILATTTSTRDSGLLDVLVPEFERLTGTKIKVIAIGTGAALAMAAKGNADAVLVHAPAAEQIYVDRGDLTGGARIMHNDFVLLGPAADPAGARGAKTLDEAMRAIAKAGMFVSRGDDSGTHKRELAAWRSAGIDPAKLTRRAETGQGMAATLHVADQRSGYTLVDRATLLAHRRRITLQTMFEGGPALMNIYHVHIVNPAKHSNVHVRQARAFVKFLQAPATQKRISQFGRDIWGRPLFVADGTARPRLPAPASAMPTTHP